MWPLVVLHYVYPTVVFCYFAVTSTFAVCTLQTSAVAAKATHVRHKVIVYLHIAFISSFVIQVVAKVVELLVLRRWPTQDNRPSVMYPGVRHRTKLPEKPLNYGLVSVFWFMGHCCPF